MIAFATVVDAGSFTAAAQRLGCSKAAVSRKVALLEERLGVRLLHRSTRRVALTSSAREFYARCMAIADEANAAQALVTNLDTEPRGLLRITVPLTFTLLHIPQLIPDFLRLYPRLRVDAVLTERKVDLAEDGFDVAFRIGETEDASLEAVRLGSFGEVVCASPEYFQHNGVPKKPQDLARHECILEAHGAPLDTWPFIKGIRVKVHGRLTTNNGQLARAAAVAGLGLAYLPTFIVGQDLKAGRLRAVLSDYIESEFPIYAVYPKSRPNSVKVKAFIDFLQEGLRTTGCSPTERLQD